MKLLSPVSIAVAIALGGASYIAINHTSEEQLTPYEQHKDYLAKKYEQKVFSPKRFDKPKEALDFYIEQRLPLDAETLPVEKYSAAFNKIKQMPHISLTTSQVIEDYTPTLNAPDGQNQELGEWQELGPGNIGGRTRALVIHPTEHDIMYAAGVAGGVWKSDNAGESWQPLSDLATNLAVTTLTLDPANPDTIYAGTGEGFFNSDALRGDGIFKSTDAGITWEQIESTASNPDFHYTNKVVHSTTDAQRIYAATRRGVQRSNDGGETWENVFLPEGTITGCLDLTVIAHEGNDVLITSCGSFYEGGVHRSVDNGTTWEAVLDFPEQGRTTLAVAPSDNNIIYALAATQLGVTTPNRLGMQGVYKSTDMGETWEATVTFDTGDDFSKLLLSNTVYGLFDQCGYGSSPQFISQGWYDNIIAVDPVNPDVVWTGGIDLFRSDDGGKSFAPTSIWWMPMDNDQYAHADQHAIVFHPAYDGVENTTMFVGNDGGIQKTENSNGDRLNLLQVCGTTNEYQDSLVNWSTLNNGYAVTQFYHGSVMPDGTAYFGGAQDNGTLYGEDGGFNEWRSIMGGDGGWTAVDPENPNIMYAETQNLNFQKSVDGGVSFEKSTNGIVDRGFPFIVRFEMAPSDSNTLYIGGAELWRTKDQAENWVAASAPFDSSVMSIAISHKNTSTVAAGTRGGFIYINNDADNADETTQWNGTQLSRGAISAIAFDPHNDKTIYATVSTFGQVHVWKTTDGGQTWNASDKGLPDIPFTTIVVDPTDTKRIIVGSDLGVFVSIDAGETWMADGSGLANTQVAKLQIHDQELFAFTHGRSVYKVDMKESYFNEAPEIPQGQSFATDENVPLGTVVGNLEFVAPNPEKSPIVAFNVYGNDVFRIDADGQIIVQNEVDYEYQSLITFTVQAVDSHGNVSNNARVQVKVNNIRGNDDDDNDGDAGSFGFLALLASPFAFLRRRRK